MKIRQHIFPHLPEPEELAVLRSLDPHLLLVFGAPIHFEGGALHARLKNTLPHTLLVGASSGGDINRSGVSDRALQFTAIHLDDPTLAWASAEPDSIDDSFFAGLKIGAQLAPHRPQHVLLFAHRAKTSAHHLLQGIKQALPGVTITGGVASNPMDFPHCFTLAPNGCSASHSVAVAFCSPRIRIALGASSGWRPFGLTRRITRSKHDVLFELDGESALDIYHRYLGQHLDNWAYSRLLFSFELLDAEGKKTGLIRAVQAMNETDGSLVLTDDISEGGYLRLMHAGTNALVGGSETAAEMALQNPLPSGEKLALMVSCFGRRIVMGQQAEEEIEAISPLLSQDFCMAGYYSQGEFGMPSPHRQECQIMNETMSLTLLGEAPC